MMKSLSDNLLSALRSGRAFAPVCWLAVALGLPASPAMAQAGPPPMPGDTAQQNANVDPPARVGRLSYISGTVSFRTLDEDQWEPAVVNYPVTEGLSFWTETDARAALELGHGVARLDGSTEVDVQQFNDQVVQIDVPQGSVNFRLHRLDPDETYQVATPSGTVALTSPGSYRIDAGINGEPGGITIFQGSAQPVGDNFGMMISAGPQARPREIDYWSDQQEAQVAQPPSYVSPDMPGVDDLADQGSWSQAPDYGPVWYPPVEAGWAPYRYGHWAFVLPWGWTWIDDAPWGFAPFHYGRWVMIGPRWAWVPGRMVERPVYAPALVAFVGGGGLAMSIGLGPVVGWVPLGPREVYVPPYGGSINYIRRVNVTNVTNVNRITINTLRVNRTTTNFVNASAATVVRPDAMTRSARISNAAVKVPPSALRAATVNSQPQVKPTLATVGAGPTAVRALGGNVSGDQRYHRAPGPKVEARPLPTALIKPLTTTGAGTGTGTGTAGPKTFTPAAGAGTGTGEKGSKTPRTNNRFAPAAGAGTGTGAAGTGAGTATGAEPGARAPKNKFKPTTGPGTGTSQGTGSTAPSGTGAPGPKHKFTPTTGPGTGTGPATGTGTGEGTGAGAGTKGKGAPGPTNRFTPTTGAGTGTTTGSGGGQQHPNKVPANAPKPPEGGNHKNVKCDPKVQKCPP